MKIESLKELSFEELYKLSRRYEIVGRTEMNKEELSEALAKKMFDENQTKIEAEIYNLGTPAIGAGSSETKLPHSGTFVQTEKKQFNEKETQEVSSIYFDGDPLPNDYNDTKLVLIPKNPQWMYAYWEISQEKKDELTNKLGTNYDDSSTLSLRMHNVTLVDFNGENSNDHFDIELPPNVKEWFINGVNPKASYVAEIGVKTAEGDFVTVARSNAVETPSDTISSNIDEEWMVVEEYFKKILEKSSAGRIVNGQWVGGMGASGAMLGSSEEMVATLMRRLFLEKGQKREKLLARLERTMAEIGLGGGRSSAGSHSMGSLYLGSQSFGSISAGSLSAVKQKGAIAQEQGKEQVEKGKIGKDRDFFLKVGTELILYGVTESDAKVKIMGKDIKLRPDGTFSLRMALPNGHYELPVEATSSDEVETRTITPIVDRDEK